MVSMNLNNFMKICICTSPSFMPVHTQKTQLKGREKEAMQELSKQEIPPTIEEFENELLPGIRHGCWAPSDCKGEQRLVVVIQTLNYCPLIIILWVRVQQLVSHLYLIAIGLRN